MSAFRNTSSAGDERRHKHYKHAWSTDMDVDQGSANGSATEYDAEGHRPLHSFGGVAEANRSERIEAWTQERTETQHIHDRYRESPVEESRAQFGRLSRQAKELAEAAGHSADRHRKTSSRGQTSSHRRRSSKAETSATRVGHAADDGEYAPQPYGSAGVGASYGAVDGDNVHGSAGNSSRDYFKFPPVNEEGTTGSYYDPRYDGPNYRPRG